MVRNLRAVACATALALLAATAATTLHDTAPAPPPASAAAPAKAAPAGSLTTLTVRARFGQLDAVTWLAASRGYDVARRSDDLNALQVKVSPDAVQRAVTDFARSGAVLYSEPSYRMAATDAPADPLYARQQDYLVPVNAPKAWDIEQGDPSVIVAVLDTGADLGHPDLAGRFWTNPSEIQNGLDDDANGCVDDLHGCAFVDSPQPLCSPASGGQVDDDRGHGTFVAGVIAANGDGAGMVGVARNVTVMPVKVLDCSGTGNSFAFAEGIIYAAKSGAKVLNVSLAGSGDAAVVREAVRRANDEFGALVVAASGNSGETKVAYPARYDTVLAVGAASGADPDTRAPFSAYGPEVDVVAVGERIVGTVPRGGCRVFLPCINNSPYALADGTSFSAPQVTGLAALILSHRPMSPAQVIDAIKYSATPLPDGNTTGWAGAGRIDMLGALRLRYRIGAPGVTRN